MSPVGDSNAITVSPERASEIGGSLCAASAVFNPTEELSVVGHGEGEPTV